MTRINPHNTRIYQFPHSAERNRLESGTDKAYRIQTNRRRLDSNNAPTQPPHLKDSLAMVKNLGSDTPINSSQLDAQQKFSEREMFTALVHHRLALKNPKAAELLEQRLPEAAKKFQEEHGFPNPARVTKQLLKEMVQSGELSEVESRSVRQFAFSQAQFDEDVSRLGIKGGDTSDSTELTLLEALERLSENALNATAGINGPDAISKGAMARKKAAGADAIGAHDAPSAAASSAGGTSHAAGSGGPPSETFLWKPQSDSNGNLVILLPASLTKDALSVSLLTPDGKRVIENGTLSGVGNGARKHFRFSKSGGSYPPGTIVQITMRDGSQRTITIPNPGQRVETK